MTAVLALLLGFIAGFIIGGSAVAIADTRRDVEE